MNSAKNNQFQFKFGENFVVGKLGIEPSYGINFTFDFIRKRPLGPKRFGVDLSLQILL